MFPAGEKDGDAVDYNGGRTSDDIVTWALEKVAENVPAPEVLEVRQLLSLTCPWVVLGLLHLLSVSLRPIIGNVVIMLDFSL